MFSTHNLNSNNISIRNLILLFLTIVFGFASVITLGNISIPTSIQNARQTIAQITITATGINTAPLIDMSGGGIFIDDSVLGTSSNFSGKVLGIDDAGNVIYVLSENLVVSGAGGGIGGDGLWTGTLGGDIRNLNSENVGIGTSTMSGKLHIKSSNQTELYLEETNPSNAANINLKNPIRTRAIGAFGLPDIFYIGEAGGTIDLVILPTGEIGIGTQTPKANLQVSGTFIAGNTNNTIDGIYSSIGGGQSNIVTGIISSIAGGGNNNISGDRSFVGGGEFNIIMGRQSVIVGGAGNKITPAGASSTQGVRNFIGGGGNNTMTGSNMNYGFIGGGRNNTITKATDAIIVGGLSGNINSSDYSSLIGGQNNEITSSTNAFIGGGLANKVTSSALSVIGGGQSNTIIGVSTHSVILGGMSNTISGAIHSFAGGFGARIINTNNTFLRNSAATPFTSYKPGSFIINVPMAPGDIGEGGVGINTNNPRTALDVNGLIRTREQTTLPTCTNNIEGSIIYDGTNFQGCTDGGRQQLNN